VISGQLREFLIISHLQEGIDKYFFCVLIKLMAELPKQPQKKNQVLMIFLIVFAIIGLFLLAKYAVPRVLVYLTKAAKPTKYSLSNSYVFGSPLVAAADGQTKIRINAFLLNDQGMGVADKPVSLTTKPKTGGVGGSPQIKDVQPITDKFGKAVFEVVSSYAGQFVTTALVDGLELPQTVTLTFR